MGRAKHGISPVRQENKILPYHMPTVNPGPDMV